MQDPASPVRASLLAEVVGWYGMAAILGAYALSSFGWLEPGRLYQALNFTGALGVGWVCWRRRTWQAFWLELVWAGVALVALVRLLIP
jgi:hypothetical protein